nr:hypothetical protein [Mesorhizobium sp. LNHC220B00]
MAGTMPDFVHGLNRFLWGDYPVDKPNLFVGIFSCDPQNTGVNQMFMRMLSSVKGAWSVSGRAEMVLHSDDDAALIHAYPRGSNHAVPFLLSLTPEIEVALHRWLGERIRRRKKAVDQQRYEVLRPAFEAILGPTLSATQP